jgi:hypothetical protein
VATVAPGDFLVYGGRTDGVSCELDDGIGNTRHEEADLTLQSRAAGTKHWRRVGTRRQEPGGDLNGIPYPARFVVTPSVNTAYRCVYTGLYPSTSALEPVLVGDVVVARDTCWGVPKGQNVVLHGHVRPAAPGRRITLRRHGRVLGHTRESDTGHFRIATPARGHGLEQFVLNTVTTSRHVGSASPINVKVMRPGAHPGC